MPPANEWTLVHFPVTLLRNVHLRDEQQSWVCRLHSWKICQIFSADLKQLLLLFVVLSFRYPQMCLIVPNMWKSHYVQRWIQILPVAFWTVEWRKLWRMQQQQQTNIFWWRQHDGAGRHLPHHLWDQPEPEWPNADLRMGWWRLLWMCTVLPHTTEAPDCYRNLIWILKLSICHVSSLDTSLLQSTKEWSTAKDKKITKQLLEFWKD